MANNFQRKGVISNAHAGRDFEGLAGEFLKTLGLSVAPSFAVEIGYSKRKSHKFDFGSVNPPILVECRSNTWTEGGKSPSAKIRGINETMLHFQLAPTRFRKMLLMLKHLHPQRNISLASHYINTQGHLIPNAVEVWEYDVESKQGVQLR